MLMKIGQFFRNAALVVAMACPMFTSCYNDAALWDEIDGIHGDVATLEQKLAALEAKLNTDLQALQTLLEGKISALEGKVDGLVTVKEVEENKDGSVTITLSDDTKFTVFPKFEQDYTGLVTTVEIDGVLYWAVYGEDGVAAPAKDANDNLIPVVDVVPQVRVDQETALVEISFDGGVEWIAIGYNEPCVFEGAEVVYTDNYTDEEEAEYPEYYQETPMYVVLTLPDGSTITVTIDGAASFLFASNYGGAITTQYIAAGSTTAIPVQAVNISDWVKEVPAGWKVVEDTQYLAEYGQAEFHVTAPTAEAIASGAAVSEGLLKVLAVAEGGKSVTASVKLTVKAFESVSAGKGNVTVKMNSGLGGYLVGVSTLADYDPEAIIAELKPVVEYVPDPDDWFDYGWSPWYVEENTTPLDDNYFDGSIEDYPIADLKNIADLVAGEQYVVWAIGLTSWMNEATWESGYYLGDIFSTTYLNASVELETTKLSFNDIQISAKFEGVTAFYGAFQMKYNDEDIRSGLVSELNSSLNSSWGAPTPVFVEDIQGMTDGVYAGDPITLVDGWQKIGPDETYYLYIIPYVEGKTKYTVADMYYYEWTTEALVSGGTLSVTPGEVKAEYKSVSVPLTAEGAVYIYYKFVDPEMVSTITDKAAYLLENGTVVAGGEASANQYNMTPGSAKTLFAMAVDQNGCYGEVFVKEYSTKAMEFASAVVKVEVQGTPSQTGLVKISCDAEVDTYYYWYKSSDHFTWSTNYYGTTVETASAYIALTPSSYYMNKVAAADLPTEGIEMTGLTVGSLHYFVVSAKLTTGEYTKATIVSFTPEMSLGNFVYAVDDNGNENATWVAAKPVVTTNVSSVGDFTTVEWSVDVPDGYTAVTACFHEDYLTNYPSAKDKVQYILTDEYVNGSTGAYTVVEGETYVNNYASPGYNIYTVICDAEGNYYETYVTELDITGGFGV